VHEKIGDGLGTTVDDFEPCRAREAASAQFVTQGERKVFHIVLVDGQLAVAGNAELVGAGDAHAGKEFIDELMQDARQEDEVVGFVGDFRRHAHDARQRARRAHEGHVPSRPNASLPSSETAKFKLLLRMRGNGCAGSRPSGESTGSTSFWK